jgi:hypothetical protein
MHADFQTHGELSFFLEATYPIDQVHVFIYMDDLGLSL